MPKCSKLEQKMHGKAVQGREIYWSLDGFASVFCYLFLIGQNVSKNTGEKGGGQKTAKDLLML